MTQIDQFSLATVPLELFFGETPLGQGTGFVWRIGERNYLVTNWHVVTGQDFFTRKNLRSDGGRPNRIRARFNIHGFFEKQEWLIPLRNTHGEPLWMVHPGRRVDIAIIPLPYDPATAIVTLYPLNLLANASLRIEIGMEVFILGYPFEIVPPAFPIWKRGSIASEPQLSRLSNDFIYVDTASRPGMSGAPVIRRSWTNHMVEPGVVAVVDRPLNRFIGVYSGRLPTDHPYEAQIGIVWDGSFIEEIIAGNCRDDGNF